MCPLALSLLYSLLSGGQQGPSGHDNSPASISDAGRQKLRYQVLATLDVFACKPASATARRQEAERAINEFAGIRNDVEAFQAIISHLGLQNDSTLGPDEKRLIACDYKKLQAIHLSPSGNRFKVTIEGEQQSNSLSSGSGMYINRDGNIEHIFVETSGPKVSPPLRDIPSQPGWKPAPEPLIRIEPLDHPEMRYRLLDHYGAFLCADDSGPAHSPMEGRRRIIATFPEIRKDGPAFRLIAQHLKLEGPGGVSDEQKIAVYHEYLKLRNIRLEKLVRKFEFSLRAPDNQARGAGFMATGLIDSAGEITLLKRQPYPLTCPK